jgi:hypothetical protein
MKGSLKEENDALQDLKKNTNLQFKDGEKVSVPLGNVLSFKMTVKKTIYLNYTVPGTCSIVTQKRKHFLQFFLLLDHIYFQVAATFWTLKAPLSALFLAVLWNRSRNNNKVSARAPGSPSGQKRE